MSNKQDIKERVESLIKKLTEGLHERHEHMAVSLLAALAGLNVFLLGPPGTAKSLLARRLKSAFANSKDKSKYFEYLMQKFSTPDELFGPVSLTALKEDKYERKTEGFLPTAHFAFLDEIWKSGPGILNTLLTLINEKIFRNGTETEKVPLQMLISASNETPPEGQGLEALYDRFVVRLYVPPMHEVENFESLLQGDAVDSDVDCQNLEIKKEELKAWREDINKVTLSEETLLVIREIRARFNKEQELKLYVSERRWKQASRLLRASAFVCGRDKTNLVDTLLLRHCLWTTVENREKVMGIVENAVRDSGLSIKAEVSDKDAIDEKTKLDKEIQENFFYADDEYDTIKIKGKDCVSVSILLEQDHYEPSSHDFWFPIVKKQSSNKFNPMDKDWQERPEIVFWFDKKGNCRAQLDTSTYHGRYWQLYENVGGERKKQDEIKVELPIKHRKGDKKRPPDRYIDSMREVIEDNAKQFDTLIEQTESRRQLFKQEVETPFVGPEQQKIALEGVDKQLDDLRVHREECNKMLDTVNQTGTVNHARAVSQTKDPDNRKLPRKGLVNKQLRKFSSHQE